MGRLARTLLVLCLVLGAGLAVTDEVARRVTQQRIAAQLAARVGATPTVHAHGWPFLLGLATGRLPGMDVDLPAGQVELGGHRLQVQDAQVHATGIDRFTTPSSARAEHVTAHALVGYSSVSRALGVTVTPAGSGRARVRANVQLAGFSLPVDLTGVPSVRDGRFVVDQPAGSAAGTTLSPQRASQLADEVSRTTPLPSRGGMHLVGLRAGDAGIELQLEGDQVAAAALR